MVVDFNQILKESGVRNISGHERGAEARRYFLLDDLDIQPDEVIVVIPHHIDALATSFFQGMFAKSVQRFGDKDKFLRHYKFQASSLIMEQILRGIERSLTSRRGAAFQH